ncbi:MAG: DUF2281 domain-containing protein [Chloroflexi bacterium]|nr:DUF2281 domain-containing protein [Chloroflexota bacterium]
MIVTEKIQQYVQRLPTSFQTEVLVFVEYLLAKAESDTLRREQRDWSGLSLALAMHGMEDEATPTYTTSDLKVVFA